MTGIPAGMPVVHVIADSGFNPLHLPTSLHLT
jgi:hypothetical protein